MGVFKEAYKKLISSSEFKEFKKKAKDTYLSYGFLIVESNTPEMWKIGFYHPKDDKVTSFVVSDTIVVEPEEAIFKAPDMKVNELKVDDIKIDYYNAIKIVDDRQKKKYKSDNPNKIVVILQNVDIGQVWNITYITERMNTLNFKVDTLNGDIKFEKLSSIMEIAKEGG